MLLMSKERLVVLIFLACIVAGTEGRGGRGGGGRGGGRRGGTSRGSFRSSGYRSVSYRYAAVGAGYFYVSRYYRTRYYTNRNFAPTICYNAVDKAPEINDTFLNGTNIYGSNRTRTYGYFLCPLTNNVQKTYCCGSVDREYCCTFWADAGRVIGAVVGMLFGIFFVAAVLVVLVHFLASSSVCKGCKKKWKRCCDSGEDKSNSVSCPEVDESVRSPTAPARLNPAAYYYSPGSGTVDNDRPPPSYEFAVSHQPLDSDGYLTKIVS